MELKINVTKRAIKLLLWPFTCLYELGRLIAKFVISLISGNLNLSSEGEDAACGIGFIGGGFLVIIGGWFIVKTMFAVGIPMLVVGWLLFAMALAVSGMWKE